jgi:hypothetical protein
MGVYSWLEAAVEVNEIFWSAIYSTSVHVDDLV